MSILYIQSGIYIYLVNTVYIYNVTMYILNYTVYTFVRVFWLDNLGIWLNARFTHLDVCVYLGWTT